MSNEPTVSSIGDNNASTAIPVSDTCDEDEQQPLDVAAAAAATPLSLDLQDSSSWGEVGLEATRTEDSASLGRPLSVDGQVQPVRTTVLRPSSSHATPDSWGSYDIAPLNALNSARRESAGNNSRVGVVVTMSNSAEDEDDSDDDELADQIYSAPVFRRSSCVSHTSAESIETTSSNSSEILSIRAYMQARNGEPIDAGREGRVFESGLLEAKASMAARRVQEETDSSIETYDENVASESPPIRKKTRPSLPGAHCSSQGSARDLRADAALAKESLYARGILEEERPVPCSEFSSKQHCQDIQHETNVGTVEFCEAGGLAVAEMVEDEQSSGHFLPSAVEHDPFSKPTKPKSSRVVPWCIVCAVAAIVIGFSGAGVGVRVGKLRRPPSVPYRETVGVRETISRYVLNASLLNDASSPYSKALKWITHADPLQLSPEDAQFHQRYIAAYFYFATSELWPWSGGCNPSVSTEDSIDCVQPLQINSGSVGETTGKRWLSSSSECLWAGVTCDSSNQIRKLEFGGLNMTGSFPDGILKLPLLHEVSLSHGHLSGPLPHFDLKVKALERIQLQSNRFEGSIPKSWYSQRNLHSIDVGGNLLTGTIGSDIGGLHDAKAFVVANNKLDGTIPSEIGVLSSMFTIALSRNNFHGTIPSSIGKLQNTHTMLLYNNRLTGTMPTEVGQMVNVHHIDWQRNRLQGQIPEEVYNCRSMYIFQINNNMLTGSLSPRISSWKNLSKLQVQSNNLSGDVPSAVGSLRALHTIDISGNSFTGTVPPEVCSRSQLLGETKTIVADCLLDESGLGIDCECCTKCCGKGGEICLAV